MSYFEVALWSGCIGIYLSYAGLSLFYALYHRSLVGLQTMLLVLSCGGLVLFGSGLGALLFSGLTRVQEADLVMGVGAFSAAYSSLGLRNFLRAEQRDVIVDRGLLGVVALCICLLVAPFWPDQQRALEVVFLGAILSALVAFWLSLRAWLLGDSFAMPMAVACLALLFAVLGLYGLPLGMFRDNHLFQSVSALCASLYVVLICHAVRRRYSDIKRMGQALAMSRDKDLLTQLWTGAAFIRQIDDAIARAKRNRKELALIGVEIYNTSMLRQQFGHHGIEQVIYGMASRVRKLGGSVSALGRYSDTSFVIVLDSVDKPRYLRSLGLRLSAGVRRPYLLNANTVNAHDFQADIGVGIARVSHRHAALSRSSRNNESASEYDSFSIAQNALHQTSVLAKAARQFPSRAAIFDDASRKALDLKSAALR